MQNPLHHPRFLEPPDFFSGDSLLKKWLLNFCLFCLAGILFFWGAWTLGAPWTVSRLENYAQQLPWEFQFKTCRVKPGWPPRIFFEDLAVRAPQSQELLLKAPLLIVTPSWKSLAAGDWVFEKMSFEKPDVYFLKNSGASWNWQTSQSHFDRPKVKSLEILLGTVHFKYGEKRGEFDLLLRDMNLLASLRPEEGLFDFDAFGFLKADREKSFTLSASYSRGSDELQGTLSLDSEKWMLEGVVLSPFRAPSFEGKLDAAGIGLGDLLKAWGMAKPLVDGEAVFEGEGRIQGVLPKEAPGALILQGGLDVRQGRFLTLNPLLQAIRGALQKSKDEVDPAELEQSDYPYLFVEGSLPFEFFQASPDVTQGRLFLKEILVKHTDYVLEAEGSYGFESTEMDFRGKLVLLEPVSAFLSEKYPGLTLFLNPQKRLVFPVVYRGLAADPVFKFDEEMMKNQLGEGSAAVSEPSPPAAPAAA